MKKVSNYKDNKYYQEKISKYKKDVIADIFAVWVLLFMLSLAGFFCWLKSSGDIVEASIGVGCIFFSMTILFIIRAFIERFFNYEVIELNVVDKKVIKGAAAGTESYKVQDENGQWYIVDSEDVFNNIIENNLNLCISYKDSIISFLDKDKYLCST